MRSMSSSQPRLREEQSRWCSCLEEFHQLKASSGTGGSELATETFRESNIKEEDRGRRNKQPPQDDFCFFLMKVLVSPGKKIVILFFNS